MFGGYNREAVLGTHSKSIGFVNNDPQFFEKIQQEPEYAQGWRGEAKNLSDKGESYDARIDIFAMRDDAQTITNFVCSFSDITESKQAENEIDHLAFYDSLTHLANRRMLIDRLKRAFFTSKHTSRDGAVLFLDLDHFKTLNQPYQLSTHEYHSTVSIGVALFGDHVDAQDDLVNHFDASLKTS